MKPFLLLSLPTEVREVVLRYAFGDISHVRLRSPSRRRLRPSRVAKHDPQGILSTCHIIREEAIPIFYAQTTLIFHCSGDAKEYLLDANIDPFIKANITHIAMDDGDSQCMARLLQNHMWLVGNAFDICTSLGALEFRIYSCHNRSLSSSPERDLVAGWRALAAGCTTNSDYGNPVQFTKSTHAGEVGDAHDGNDAINSLPDNTKSIRVLETQATYTRRMTTMSETPVVTLFCYNMMVNKDACTKPVLGNAKEAVERRKARVGAIYTNNTDYDADSCPDRNEVQYVKELEDSLRNARAATRDGGAGRCPWGSMRISSCIPTAARA
ncbi:hypothetical protein DV737_g1569, partial [Chaetothyriales sp. CBS 132003]